MRHTCLTAADNMDYCEACEHEEFTQIIGKPPYHSIGAPTDPEEAVLKSKPQVVRVEDPHAYLLKYNPNCYVHNFWASVSDNGQKLGIQNTITSAQLLLEVNERLRVENADLSDDLKQAQEQNAQLKKDALSGFQVLPLSNQELKRRLGRMKMKRDSKIATLKATKAKLAATEDALAFWKQEAKQWTVMSKKWFEMAMELEKK